MELSPSTGRMAIQVPKIVLLFLGIAASIGISYFIVSVQKKQDYKYLNQKVDELFQSKDEICDTKSSGVVGNLFNIRVETMFGDLGGDSLIRGGRNIIMTKPKGREPLDEGTDEGNKYLNKYVANKHEVELAKWNELVRLADYYECKSGGFKVLTLTKKDNGYDLVESVSGDMAYKIPSSTWTPGTDYGYGIVTTGYSTPTFRATVQQAYDGAMEYLSSEKENKSYTPGSYDKILGLGDLKSDLHSIDNVAPTKVTATSKRFASWKSTSNAYIFNPQWIVWYSYTGKHYEIVEDKAALRNCLIIYSAIGVVLSILTYLFFLYRGKVAISIK